MKRQKENKSSIYWRGPAEQDYYREMQKTARSYGFRSWSDFAKLILKDPLKFLKFGWIWWRSDYDGVDVLKLLEGEVPDRDLILKEAEKMTVEQLRNGLMAQRAAERLVAIYKEVYEEVLDRKLKELNKAIRREGGGARRGPEKPS